MQCGVLPATSVEVGEYSGRSTTVPTPVSFGVVFKQGEIVGPNIVPLWNGTQVQAQVDVLSTWPDSTVKHARISFLAPAILANSINAVTLQGGAPSQPSQFIANVTSDDVYNFLNVQSTTGGVDFFSLVNQTTASALIADAVAQNPNATAPAGFKRNAFGKIVCEYEKFIPFQTAGGFVHPWIKTLVRIRLWSQWRGAFIDWSIENSPVPNSSSQTWVNGTNYGSMQFNFIRLVVGNAAQLVRYNYTGFPSVGSNCKILTDTRCRISGWTKDNGGSGNGGPAPMLYTIQDFRYLADNLIVPKYDYNNPIDGTTLGAYTLQVAGERKFGVSEDLTANPNGMPYLTDPLRQQMDGTGGSADRGPLCTWDIYILNSQGSVNRANAWKVSYAASSNAAGTYGGTGGSPAGDKTIHARDPVTNAPGIPGASGAVSGCRTQVWGNNAWKNQTADNYTTSHIDWGHTPNLAYVMWMLTAESWFAEELCFWGVRASYRGLSGANGSGAHAVVAPVILFGDRYGGWPLRDSSNAAFLLPDNYYYAPGQYCGANGEDTIRGVPYAAVKNTMEFVRQFRDEGLEPLHLSVTVRDSSIVYWGGQEAGGRRDFQCGVQSSPWANAYFIWSLFQIWGYFRSKNDSVGTNAERNYDWYSHQYVYVYVDPREHPEYHQRNGFACYFDTNTQALVDYAITYRVNDWAFSAPDTVTTVDWAQQTVGLPVPFDRRLLWLSVYSSPVAVYDSTPDASKAGCGKLVSSSLRPLSNLGELAWYTAVNVDLQFNAGPPQSVSCPITSSQCALPQVDWNNNSKTPPWPPQAWRVCGWTGDDASGAHFHDVVSAGQQSNGSYFFHFAVPCMSTFQSIRGDATGLAAANACWSYLYPHALDECGRTSPASHRGTIMIP